MFLALGSLQRRCKAVKYATLQGTHLFQQVVVESLGSVEEATSSFLAELGHCRISAFSGVEIVVRLAFCFNAFLFLCSDLTLFCCGRVLLQAAARMMTYRVIHLA